MEIENVPKATQPPQQLLFAWWLVQTLEVDHIDAINSTLLLLKMSSIPCEERKTKKDEQKFKKK